jgi:hypothetical protein
MMILEGVPVTHNVCQKADCALTFAANSHPLMQSSILVASRLFSVAVALITSIVGFPHLANNAFLKLKNTLSHPIFPAHSTASPAFCA